MLFKKELIDKSLKKYLPKGNDIIKKAMRYSVFSGGKRIRPVIAIESSRLCGGTIKDVMCAACAIEFVHTYSLIHDDLPAMDNDDFRRGKPTCHKVFGETTAILAGDALLTLAFNIIAKHMDPRVGLIIIEELSEAAGADGMVLGQALDLEYHKRKKGNDISEINLLKTAKLFEASAKIGALAEGADPKRVKALQGFGLYFGLSFQLVDDVLDGEKKERGEASLFMEKAKRELEIFGKKADKLKEISNNILETLRQAQGSCPERSEGQEERNNEVYRNY